MPEVQLLVELEALETAALELAPLREEAELTLEDEELDELAFEDTDELEEVASMSCPRISPSGYFVV